MMGVGVWQKTAGLQWFTIRPYFILPPFIYADVKTGDKTGEIQYFCDGRYIDSIDICAMKNTEYKSERNHSEKSGFLERIKNFLFKH